MTRQWTIRLLSVQGNMDGSPRTCFMVDRPGVKPFRFKPFGLSSGGGCFEADDGDGHESAQRWLDTKDGRDMMLAANDAQLKIERTLKLAKIEMVKLEWDGTTIPSQMEAM